jgi:nitroreductase
MMAAMEPFSEPPDDLAPDDVARLVVAAARHAPSVYGSAPWRFSVTGTDVCVHADDERRLPIADPAGRELTISCGAAVFTARVALRQLGLRPEVAVFPEPGDPRLVARIRWAPADREAPSVFERSLYAQIAAASPHQGGFAYSRLPDGVLPGLGEEAASEDAALVIMTDDDHRAALLAVLETASAAFRLNSDRAAEAASYHQEGSGAGWELPPADLALTPVTAGILTILTTKADEPASWVAAGQALQRVLLAASGQHAAVAVSSQALEFGHLRAFTGAELTAGLAPQLILRFGPTANGVH